MVAYRQRIKALRQRKKTVVVITLLIFEMLGILNPAAS